MRHQGRVQALALFLSCTSSLAACSGSTGEFGSSAAVVEGRVTTAESGAPVAEADVEVRGRRLREGVCGEDLPTGADVVTDDLGAYEASMGLIGESPIACVTVAVTPPLLSGLEPATADGIVEFRSGEPGRVRIDVALDTVP